MHAFYYFSPNRCKLSYQSGAFLRLGRPPYQPGTCSTEEASKTVEELKCVLPGAFILSG